MRGIVLFLMPLPTALPAAVREWPCAALVTPEVACNVVPSHSAKVAEVLKLNGNA